MTRAVYVEVTHAGGRREIMHLDVYTQLPLEVVHVTMARLVSRVDVMRALKRSGQWAR